ncbi:MAG: stage V sporulation protein AD [Oscillospiraceae bacterium]|nr:stage V sporulation protein AD [Oscillospiraceae bacterium]
MIEYANLIRLNSPPTVAAWSSVAGKKEGEGPMAPYFDRIEPDGHFGAETWEQAESELQRRTLNLMLEKAGCSEGDISCIFAGDLINQCTSSTYALRHLDIPYLGIFGACATFAEGLLLAAVMQSGMELPRCAVLTSSHFSSAERQFRFPLSYGGQRTPNAQWTCTAAGAALLTPSAAPPYLRGICIGRIRDQGLTDASNMGAAMAPAAADTIARYLSATRTRPADYDAIVTGDLGAVGSRLMLKLMEQNGYDLRSVHRDCGVMMFNSSTQDTHAGGSGCGCSASIICGYFLPKLQSGELRNVLYAATGALLSPMLCQQGESIPGICHLVHLSHTDGKEQL